jgi:hypothetical protein
MPIRPPSASRWPRVVKCPASHALAAEEPIVTSESDAASLGTAVHKYLELYPKHGTEASQMVEEFARPFCESLSPDDLPLDAKSFSPEVKFFYDPFTRIAWPDGEPIPGGCDPVRAITGVADVVGLAVDHVYVGDYKTGHSHLGKAGKSMQLKVLALAASKAFSRDKVVIQFLRLTEFGQVFKSTATLEAFDLFEIEEQIATTLADAEQIRANIAAGKPYEVRQGEHCRYCPSFHACPANAKLVSYMVNDPDALEMSVKSQLTVTNAPEAYARYKRMKDLVNRIGKAIHGFARETPISIGNGLELRESETKRESLDGSVVFDVIKEIHGEEIALLACEMKSSKAGIKKAMREVPRTGKVTLTSLEGEILSGVRAKGGSESKTSSSVKEVKERS